MRKFSKIVFSLFLVLTLFGRIDNTVRADDPDPYITYLPLISKRIPPQRLGPYLSKTGIAFAVQPGNSAVVYAGTYGGGVFKSKDGGASWNPASLGLPTSPQLLALAIDPTNTNRIYAGLYYNYTSDFASGVYRSDDGGANWTATAALINPSVGTNRPVVYALAVASNGTIYAGTRTKDAPDYGYGGVFKSTNNGVSWSLMNNQLPADDLYIYDVTVDPADPSTVYAGVHAHGLYRSSDAGEHWKRVFQDSSDTSAQRVVDVDPFSPNTVVFGTVDRPTYRSQDYGGNWSSISLDNMYSLSNDQSHADGLYGIARSNNAFQLYYSSNYGYTQNLRSSNLSTPYFLADQNNGNTLFLGGGDGSASVYKSTDGGYSFSPSASGISGYAVSGLAVDPGNASHMYAALFGWGMVVSYDGGLSWGGINNGLPTTSIQGLALDPGNANIVYALTQVDGVYKTSDGGGSWTPINSGYPASLMALGEYDNLPFQPLAPLEPATGAVDEGLDLSLNAISTIPGLAAAVSTNGTVLLGTAGRGVYKGNGSSWSATGVSAGWVYALLFDKSDATRAWLGGDPNAGSLRVGTGSGASWGAGNAGLAGRTVYALSQGQSNPDVLMAGTDAGVYRSSDHGVTWTASGLSGAVKAVAVHPVTANRLLAATAAAVYVSNDGGATWSVIDANFNQFGYLGVATTPAAAGNFYFYSRFGGVVRFTE